MNKEIYVGPYLRIKPKKVKKEVVNRFCPNHVDGPIPIGSKYCPRCGHIIESKNEIIDEYQDVESLIPEDTFVFPNQWSKKQEIAIGNNSINDGGIWMEEDDLIIDIKTSSISKDLLKFTSYYKDAIETLQKETDGVKLSYGTIVFYL